MNLLTRPFGRFNLIARLIIALAVGCVLAGSREAWASYPPGETSDFRIVWSPTNNLQANVFGCDGLPVIPSLEGFACQMQTTSIAMDGGGRLEGVGFMTVFFDDTGTNFTQIVLDATGNMSTKSSTSAVTLKMKGDGRSHNVSEDAKASASLKFTGNVESNFVVYVSAIYVVTVATNSLFETNRYLGYVTNGSPVLNGTNFVSNYETNALTRTNVFEFVAQGYVNGTVTTGLKSVKVPKVNKQTGYLLPSGPRFVLDSSGTNFVLENVRGGLIVQSLDIEGRVVRFKKMLFGAGDLPFVYDATGNMDTNKGTYKATLTGKGWGRTSTIDLVGTNAVVTNAIIIIGTNPPIPVTATIPGSAKANGKAFGQKVKLASGVGLPLEP